MGVLDNIFGGDKGPAVPGGSVAKPLMIALLALAVAKKKFRLRLARIHHRGRSLSQKSRPAASLAVSADC